MAVSNARGARGNEAREMEGFRRVIAGAFRCIPWSPAFYSCGER